MSKSKLTILILALLTLGLVGWGCLKKPAVNQNQNQYQNTNTNINTATSTDDIDTSDWKTYRNEEYGFEVKYPSEWYLDACKKEEGFEDIIAIISDDEVFCNVNMNESTISLQIIKEYNYNKREKELINFSREDLEGYVKLSGDIQYTDAEGNIRPDQWVRIIDTIVKRDDDYNLVIRFHRGYGTKGLKFLEKDIMIYDIIVNTFKFIK